MSSPSPPMIGGVTSAGDTGHGVRRIIPIIGGEVRGEGINGKVCAFGADFQIIRPNELIELEAKYAFETDDGAVVYVENRGIRFGPVELMQRLKRGEAGRSETDLFPHRAEVRDRQRKIPLADGTPVCRIGGPPRRPRRARRASGAVRGGPSGSPPVGGSLSCHIAARRPGEGRDPYAEDSQVKDGVKATTKMNVGGYGSRPSPRRPRGSLSIDSFANSYKT